MNNIGSHGFRVLLTERDFKEIGTIRQANENGGTNFYCHKNTASIEYIFLRSILAPLGYELHRNDDDDEELVEIVTTFPWYEYVNL